MVFVGQDVFRWENYCYWDWYAIAGVETMNWSVDTVLQPTLPVRGSSVTGSLHSHSPLR
jgi:hypothetical protein